MAGQSGHRARPSQAGRRGKLAQGPTQHNGLSHVACPQAAAKALLGGPAARDPRYVLRPLPCACGLLLTACSNKPHAEAAIGVCGHGWGRHHRGSGQALRAASRVVGPPTPGRLLRRLQPCGLPARCSQTGPPLSQTAGQPTAEDQQPARRCAPCPRSGARPRHTTPALLIGEGAAAVPGSKGRCAPRKRGGPWPALTA